MLVRNRIDGTLKGFHQRVQPVAFRLRQNGLIACQALGVGYGMDTVDKFRRTAYRTKHNYSSLNETTSTSSTTVTLIYNMPER